MKNILDREGISYQEELAQLKNSTNTEPLKRIKEVVLFFQMKSQKIWQIGFLHVFGVVQTYTQKE